MVRKMALIRGNGGLDIRFCVRDPEKHILGRNRMFWRILRQNPSTALGFSELQEPPPFPPKKLTRFWCAKLQMRRNETPGWIVTNCCTGVGVHDVITCADLYYDRLQGLGLAGGQILGFSIDLLSRPYYRASVWFEPNLVQYTTQLPHYQHAGMVKFT